jgi:cyclopropane-fatty-acyl-phospholipid synthase
VLDIGSGWGGLGIYLAKSVDADVTGVTLSTEQLRISNQRAARKGLQRAVRFELKDYRKIGASTGSSRSACSSMWVSIITPGISGRSVHSWRTTVWRSFTPSAARSRLPQPIFPGGYIPALSEMVHAIERSGLIIADIEILRLHYANTLRAWRERFLANWDKAAAIRGERFCRMWEFYLAGSEAALRYQDLVVFQVQLIKRIDALPFDAGLHGRCRAAAAPPERSGAPMEYFRTGPTPCVNSSQPSSSSMGELQFPI